VPNCRSQSAIGSVNTGLIASPKNVKCWRDRGRSTFLASIALRDHEDQRPRQSSSRHEPHFHHRDSESDRLLGIRLKERHSPFPAESLVNAVVKKSSHAVSKNIAGQTLLLAAIALLLGNVNALVDSALHPDIPYFDREHLIVGGITSSIGVILFVLLLVSFRRLAKARARIGRLEAMLPICANCKKIRKSATDPQVHDSWQSLESYITEQTRTVFSHGICPECMAALYSGQLHAQREQQGSNLKHQIIDKI